MAGFMSGFGAAFTQSFNQERQATLQKESDKFRMDYANALTRRDKEVEQDKINKKNIKAAKAIANATGNPDASWTTFYDMLSGGANFDDVMKFGTENQAVISNGQVETNTPGTASAAEGGGNLPQAAQSSVNAQMTESGMKPPANGGIFGNLGANQPASNPIAGQAGMPQTPEQAPAQNTPSPAMNGGVAGQTAGATAGQVAENGPTPSAQAPKPENIVEEQNLPGNSDGKITWQKRSASQFKAPNPWEVTNTGDALAYKTWAYERGGEADRKRADNLVNTFAAMDQAKIRQTGIANGTYSEPIGATLIKPDGTQELLTKSYDTNSGAPVWLNAEGQPVQNVQGRLVEHTPAMEKDLDDMADKMVKPVEDYTTAVNDFKQTNKTGSELIKLVEAHPEAAGLSGDALQFFDKWKLGLQNLLYVATPDGNAMLSPQTMKIAEDAEANLEERMKGPLDKADKAATAAALIDIKATKLAYMAAAAQGQSGKNVAVSEFEKFKDNILAGGKPSAMKLGIASTVQDQYDNLKLQASNVNVNSSLMRRFKNKYGINSPFQPVDDPDSILKTDDDTRQQFEYLQNASKAGDLTQTRQPNAEVPSWVPPEMAPDYQYMDEETKKLLQKQYGG